MQVGKSSSKKLVELFNRQLFAIRKILPLKQSVGMNISPEISLGGIFLQVTITCCMRGSPLGAGEAIPLPATDLSAARFITNCLRSLCCSSILTTTSSTFYLSSFSSVSSSSPLCPLLLGIHQGPVRVRLFAPALRCLVTPPPALTTQQPTTQYPERQDRARRRKKAGYRDRKQSWARPAGSLGGD